MKRLLLVCVVGALLLAGCGGFSGQSDIDLGDDQSVTVGAQVTISGKNIDLSGVYSTDFTGFTIDFELDTPENSSLGKANVTQSGPIFIFTPDVAGDYYFYAWVYLNSDAKNIGVDVVKVTVAAAS